MKSIKLTFGLISLALSTGSHFCSAAPRTQSSGEQAELESCLENGDAAEGYAKAIYDCYLTEFGKADSELNLTYKSISGVLPIAQRKILREMQRGWIKLKEEACVGAWRASSSQGVIPEDERLLQVSCLIRMTRERNQYLNFLAQTLGSPRR